MTRVKASGPRACPLILGYFPVRSRVENLALIARRRLLIYPHHPCPPRKRLNSRREVPISSARPRTIIQADLSHHSTSLHLMTTGSTIALLPPPAVTNGMAAQGITMLLTCTLPVRSPARCHMQHTSIHHPAWIQIGTTAAQMLDTLIFQPHHQLLHSLPRDFRFWGLITFEIITPTDTRQVTKILSGRHSMQALLESTPNFHLPLEILHQTFMILHRKPSLDRRCCFPPRTPYASPSWVSFLFAIHS